MQLSDRIGRRLKLHDLHVLMAVVQAGSMNKAAALLHTTQPAVSRSVAELERTMGVRLLDRKCAGRGTDRLWAGTTRWWNSGVRRSASGGKEH